MNRTPHVPVDSPSTGVEASSLPIESQTLQNVVNSTGYVRVTAGGLHSESALQNLVNREWGVAMLSDPRRQALLPRLDLQPVLMLLAHQGILVFR
jgi:hypothetical protein